MSNPYQTPPDPYGGQAGQPYRPAPGYGAAPGYAHQQPGYGQQAAYGQQVPVYGYPAQPAPPPYGMAPAPTGEPNNLATASVALGFVSVIACYYGIILAPVALGLGIAGVNRAKTTGTGRSAALGGIVLSTLAILIAVAALVFFVVLDKKLPV